MKHVSIFPFIIVTNKYFFFGSSPSSVNVKIVFWTIAKVIDKEGWINEFNYLKF